MDLIQLKAMWWVVLDLFEKLMNSRIVNAVYRPLAGILLVPLVVSFGAVGILDQWVREREIRRRQARQ